MRAKRAGSAMAVAAAVSCLLAWVLGAGCRSASARSVAPQQRLVTGPAEGSSGAISVVDALGNEVRLSRPAKRVVSLAPNLTEIVCLVGGEEQLVGVTDFCKYPPQVRNKPKIGGIINPSLEKVLALKPDLLLVARGTDLRIIERMRKSGVAVYAADPRSVRDVIVLVRTVGRLLGRDAEADAAARHLEKRLAALTSKPVATGSRPKALAVVELEPLFVAGSDSFLDDLLRLAGLENAARGEKPWARWSSERVLNADPDLILVVRAHGAVGTADADLRRQLAHRAPWSTLRAVRTGHVYSVTDDLVTIPGPRLLDGLQEVVSIRQAYERRTAARGAAGLG